MAVITPDTYVKLVRFDATPEHQLTFSNVTAQTNFFNSLTGLVLSDFTYQRKDNVIRYPALYEDIEKYNYLLYRNEAQSNKTYYCYITDLKYINDEMTEIRIETDVFQTWQFDIIYKQMFVEREHVMDDTIGLHTVPENLETGESIVNTYTDINMSDYCYILYTTKNLSTGADVDEHTNMGGIPVAKRVYVCKDYQTLDSLLQSLPALQINTDAITNIYLLPKACINHDFSSGVLHFQGQNNPVNSQFQISKPYNLDGYVPKNGKLFTYPFCYLVETNNLGLSNILHFEKFKNQECTFEFYGIPSQNSPAKIIPVNYGKENQEVDIEGIILGKLPTLDWNNDYYSDWLLSNSNTLDVEYGFATVRTGLGLGKLALGFTLAGTDTSGNPMAGSSQMFSGVEDMISGLQKISLLMAQDADKQMIPNSSRGNSSGGDITTAMNKNCFTFYEYTLKEEFARKIDNFFSMAGYQVNDVKIPNIEGRLNWNYVKTIDCNIEGTEIPEKDLNKLKAMFNRGITFWHNYSTFRDYSQNNPIVT